MTMIILKDSGKNPIAVDPYDVRLVEYREPELSVIHIRVGSESVVLRIVNHSVEEITAALNKTNPY